MNIGENEMKVSIENLSMSLTEKDDEDEMIRVLPLCLCERAERLSDTDTIKVPPRPLLNN